MNMPSMHLKEALQKLRGPHCLWVGAGVTKQLAPSAPTWRELVDEFERSVRKAGKRKRGADLPTRLDEVARALGHKEFKRGVRRKILGPVLRGLASSDATRRASQLRCLGLRANPIVNFNVETVSSRILAGTVDTEGATRSAVVRCYSGKRRDSHYGAVQVFGAIDTYPQIVVHPHGAIDGAGPCVLTKSDYKQHDGLLAFQIAIHAAFAAQLVIVGMSLDDKYLRKQIKRYREQIGEIIWFCPPCHLKEWAWKREIRTVDFAHDEFWEGLEHQELDQQRRSAWLKELEHLTKDVLDDEDGGRCVRDWARKEHPREAARLRPTWDEQGIADEERAGDSR